MDAQVLATEDIMKIEMEGVGFQAVQTDTKPFELYNASWNLCFKCDMNKDSKNAVSDRGPVPEITDQINIIHEPDDYFVDDLASRTAICLWITKEHNYAKVWIKSEPEEELKVESSLDSSEKYSVLEITEEFIIKDECNDDDKFLDANPETASNRSSSECNVTNGQNLTATGERRKMKELIINVERMNLELIKKIKHSQNTDTHQLSEKAKVDLLQKSALKQKTMVKQQSIACKKLSRNLVYCNSCNYSARSKYILIRHMKEHRNLKKHKNEPRSSYKHITCIHCNAKFRSKRSLDDHVLKQHSDLVASVSSKTHKCSHCAYKTTYKSSYRIHMLKHSETASKYKFGICTHCNAKFKSKWTLYEHIIREHPDFITSLSCKLYHCTCCAYKTTFKSRLAKHMFFKHSESVGNYKFFMCVHCTAKFKYKHMLDNHIVKEHPDFIASVSAKIHECKHCEYKTTMKNCLASHVWKHRETVDNYKFIICIHCNEKFKFKHMLDNHIIKEHPGFIASITARIYECKHCEYKTTMKTGFSRHMLKHRERVDNYKFRICIHCKAKFKTISALNDHLVQKHPDFTASVSSKIHECTHCAYKSVFKSKLDRHMSKHSKLEENHKFSMCIHCNAKLKGTRTLNDHIVRKHPEFIASVSAKIYICTRCAYKTVKKNDAVTHMKTKHRMC
ncbi:unnamed protein product [Acanthoscelides obtectus]|uniref:C2H2-type domain-containing protein n=1 Tax=Acanthoscelides obtectus TaxID=200917 RepID=A0A9P0KLF4_ACAOB|nr:unnamed protein product [Acanthoscelides obtectus]CAK1665147.1 Zinc finger protein 711 [Acanthoscelides obtectus]